MENNRTELDMNEILKSKFSAGQGVLQILSNMTDDMLLGSIKHAIAISGGKSFTVIPPAVIQPLETKLPGEPSDQKSKIDLLTYKLETLSSYSVDDIEDDSFDVLYGDDEGRECWVSESIIAVAKEAAQKLTELSNRLGARIPDQQREEIITVLQAISGGLSDDPAQDVRTLLSKMVNR